MYFKTPGPPGPPVYKPGESFSNSDEYWKLGSYDYLNADKVRDALTQGGYYYPKGAKKAKLMESYYRVSKYVMMEGRLSHA